jgi:hypothetical protein
MNMDLTDVSTSKQSTAIYFSVIPFSEFSAALGDSKKRITGVGGILTNMRQPFFQAGGRAARKCVCEL